MARRIWEAEALQSEGIRVKELGSPKSINVVKEITLHKSYNGVFSVQFNYTGTVLAVGMGAGGIQTYDPMTGKLIRELRPCRQGGYQVMTLRFHPKNCDLLYAGTAEGVIYVYNVETGEEVLKLDEAGNEINTMDFCVDGFNFVTGGKDLNVRVYETNKNALLRVYEGGDKKRDMSLDKQTVANTMRVFSIKFHPNNQYLFVSGGWDNHIKIWDIRDNDGIKRNIHGPHVAGDSLDMIDNNILAGQWAALHALQQYDYTSGKVVKEINYPHKDGAFLYTASYVTKDVVMAGGSGTNSLELMELSTDRHVGGYQMKDHPVHCSDASHDGRYIAVGSSGPVLAILNVKDK